MASILAWFTDWSRYSEHSIATSSRAVATASGSVSGPRSSRLRNSSVTTAVASGHRRTPAGSCCSGPPRARPRRCATGRHTASEQRADRLGHRRGVAGDRRRRARARPPGPVSRPSRAGSTPAATNGTGHQGSEHRAAAGSRDRRRRSRAAGRPRTRRPRPRSPPRPPPASRRTRAPASASGRSTASACSSASSSSRRVSSKMPAITRGRACRASSTRSTGMSSRTG